MFPYPPALVQAPRWAGIGLPIPDRKADCTGARPSWFPFQVNVCDWAEDAPESPPLTGRQLTIPAPQPIPWTPPR